MGWSLVPGFEVWELVGIGRLCSQFVVRGYAQRNQTRSPDPIRAKTVIMAIIIFLLSADQS